MVPGGRDATRNVPLGALKNPPGGRLFGIVSFVWYSQFRFLNVPHEKVGEKF